jgi:hypothetical protein
LENGWVAGWVVLIAGRGCAYWVYRVTREPKARGDQRTKQGTNATCRAPANVGHDVIDERDIPRNFALLQGPLLFGSIYLPQIVNAGIRLGVCAGMDVVGNRNGRQQSYDGYYDHDFNKRKTRLPRRLILHN